MNTFYKDHTGALEDEKDERDFSVSTFSTELKEIDLSQYNKQIRRQKFNDCVICSFNTLFEMEYLKKYNEELKIKNTYGLSTGFGYTEARKIYGTFPDNTGLLPREVVKQYRKIGNAPEYFMPYKKYTLTCEPDKVQLFTSNFFKVKQYEAVTPDQVPYVLSGGKPVFFAINLDGNFLNYKAGDILDKHDGKFYGGHAMVFVGQHFRTDGMPILKFVNSWGTGFGANGYYYATLDYIKRAAGNRIFWVIYV